MRDRPVGSGVWQQTASGPKVQQPYLVSLKASAQQVLFAAHAVSAAGQVVTADGRAATAPAASAASRMRREAVQAMVVWEE